MKLFRLIVVVVVVTLLAVGVYYVREINNSDRQIAATSAHEAYCNELTNAANLYFANPYETKSGMKAARELFVNELNQGIGSTKVLSVTQVYNHALEVRNDELSIQGWDDWTRSLIAVYQSANNC